MRKNTVASLVGLLLLAGCDGDQSGNQVVTITDSELTLPLPERIRSINVLDPNSITATATVNGVLVTLLRNSSGGYSGDIQVPARSTFLVDIEFSEQFSGQNLVLATSSQQVTTSGSNQQINLRRSSYNFGSHDSDADSVSNIVEREEDTDPLDGTQAPPMINIAVVARQPQALQSSNFGEYFFEASVGRDAKVLSSSGSDFRSDFYVVDRAPLSVSVQMIETFTGQQLVVATQARELDVITDQQTVIFEGDIYSTTDLDDDGQSDLAELIAGTDVNVPESPITPANTFTAEFSVPAVMQDALSIYVEYRVSNQITNPTRTVDSFSATTNATAGSIVTLDVAFFDNFNGNPYVLGTAQKVVEISSGEQTISFTDSDFLIDQDDDADGTVNYLERIAGTDPFNAPVVVTPDPVSCAISPIPATAGLPGDSITVDDISSYIDCGEDTYDINATDFNFSWNQAADTIDWLIPDDSVGGSVIEYQIEVANPSLATDVYATDSVFTTVEESQCTSTISQILIEASADIFIQNGQVFNINQLRVNPASRRALIGFDVPAQEGELKSASLVVTVGDDSGSGVIGVYQDDTVQWSETDTEITFSELTNLIGFRDGAWQTDTATSIGLTELYVSGPRVNLFLQQDSGGNDVSFSSRETADAPVLVLDYESCIDDE